MLRDLNYYVAAAREAVANNKDRDDIYAKIDDAHHNRFENPKELRELPWIGERKFVTTAPADALNAAIRTFASRKSELQIYPNSDSVEEYDRVERIEEAMKWEMTRMNAVGRKSAHWKIVEYAMKYCAVAVETVHLPYVYQDVEKTPRIKEILKNRFFQWNVHDPSNIYSIETDGVLEMVLNTTVKSAYELLAMFGEKATPLLAEHKLDASDIKSLMSTYFTLYDYTDWDARVKWVTPNSGSQFVNKDVPSGFELLRQERTISFLPWVVVDNEEPLLKGMVEAGLYDTTNILRTMQFSKAVDMAAHPEYWIQTPDGTLRGVSLDNQNPNQPLVTAPGVSVNKLIPPQLDPQMATMTAQAESEVFRTTVAQILASVEKYAGTQNFSVVNAMLNAAIAQLSLSQMVAERAETLAVKQNFRWIEETGIPMYAFRTKSNGEHRPKGQEISIKVDDFDTQHLYLEVKLNPVTITDKQAEINNVINMVERLGMSKEMAWDELRRENYELNEAKKTEEDLYAAWIAAEGTRIMQAPEVEAQQAAQGAEQTQFAGQQGMDTRGGGMSAAMAGMGREQLNSMDAAGNGLA